MQPCDKLLKSCSWAGNPFNCSILFKTVDSYLGHCCGFNYHIAETHPQMSVRKNILIFSTEIYLTANFSLVV